MERIIYNYNKNKISEHTITIYNYPLDDVLVNKIGNKIYKSTNVSEAISKALEDHNLEAIENFLGDDRELWILFSKLFIAFLQVEYLEITDNTILNSFERSILSNPNFIVTNMNKIHERYYPFFIKYLGYAYITNRDFYYMLSKDRNLLIDKLNDMVRSRFPDRKYDENIIETILSYGRNLTNMPKIIKKFVRTDIVSDKLEDFIITKYKKRNDRSYSSGEDDHDDSKRYYIKGTDIYFNTYYYKDKRIVLEPVIIRTNKNTIRLFNKLGPFYILYNSTLNDIFERVIKYKNSIKPIVEFLGNKKKEWVILCSVLSKSILNRKYVEENRDSFLTLFNHPYFRITSDMISKPLNRDSDLLDEIKLKSDRDVIPNYINIHTNKNVLAYLIYDLLNDVFKNDRYWKLCYKYFSIVNSYTDIITDRVDNTSTIREICEEEGISVLHYRRYMYNILTLLCIEYYTLKKDLSGINTLKEYTQRISYHIDNLSDKLYYDKLFIYVLDL